MDNRFNTEEYDFIGDFIKLYNNNDLSLNILKRTLNNSYYLLIEIKPLDCSKSRAIKCKKMRLQIIKYGNGCIPKSKLYKCLQRNLKKCQKGKITNNRVQKLYFKLLYPNIYKKYFNFDATVIVIIVLVLLFIFGVIWSAYHNSLTNYMLTH